MKKVFVLAAIVFMSLAAAQAQQIDLSSTWSFELDPNDIGIASQWYNRQLSDSVRFPGSLQ